MRKKCSEESLEVEVNDYETNPKRQEKPFKFGLVLRSEFGWCAGVVEQITKREINDD